MYFAGLERKRSSSTGFMEDRTCVERGLVVLPLRRTRSHAPIVFRGGVERVCLSVMQQWHRGRGEPELLLFLYKGCIVVSFVSCDHETVSMAATGSR